MPRPLASRIHAAHCRCSRCDPDRPTLAERFADAMEPGDIAAIRLGLAGAIVAGAGMALLKYAPAILAAVASIGGGQ